MQQIYKRTPKSKCNFNKVTKQLYNEITLWHECFPVNLLYIFRAPFPKNSPRWLLLFITNLIKPLTDCRLALSRPALFCIFLLSCLFTKSGVELPNWGWYQKSVVWSQQTFVLVKTYWRRLKDVFSVSFCLPRCLQDIRRRKDILKTLRRRRLVNTSWRRFEGALKTP